MKTPVRTCAGCGKRRPKHEMIRVGLDRDGEFLLGGAGKVPGRGVYLCPDGRCVEAARRRGSLQRSLGAGVPGELFGEIERLCEERE
ncbi:MAG: YlxR family protein [Actinobacteria bacterium]|nr:YlxR family protein [Actinomycetota bacterium]MBU2689232.1 YlxR family protein [Actinomycetota bacterium]